MTAVLDRTTEQRLAALARGNEIRTYRARLKHGLTFERAAEVVVSPPAWTESMAVVELLRALPYWGRVKARRALLTCRVADTKTLGGLSDRQRCELVALLAAKVNDSGVGRHLDGGLPHAARR